MSSIRSLRGVRAPKQERSRRVLRRVVQATRELLSANDARDVSLREIGDHAEVSMSSLFARFPSKDSLLDYVHAEHCEQRTEDAERVVATLAAETLSPAEIAERAIFRLLDWTAQHGRLEQSLRSAAEHHDGIRQREARSQHRRLRLLRRFVLQVVGEEADEESIEAAIRLVLAAAPEFDRQLCSEQGDRREREVLAARLAAVVLPSFGVLPSEPPGPLAAPRVGTQEVLDAAQQLFDGRSIADVSEAEIADAAGITVDELHDHVRAKRELLHALLDRVEHAVVQFVEPLAEIDRWRGRRLHELVEETSIHYARFWERFGGLVTTMRQAEEHDPELKRRRARLDREVEDRIVAVIAQLVPELMTPDRERETRRRLHTLAAGIRASQDRPALFELDDESEYRRWLGDFVRIAEQTLATPRCDVAEGEGNSSAN